VDHTLSLHDALPIYQMALHSYASIMQEVHAGNLTKAFTLFAETNKRLPDYPQLESAIDSLLSEWVAHSWESQGSNSNYINNQGFVFQRLKEPEVYFINGASIYKRGSFQYRVVKGLVRGELSGGVISGSWTIGRGDENWPCIQAVPEEYTRQVDVSDIPRQYTCYYINDKLLCMKPDFGGRTGAKQWFSR
jgi:hypothetical protein